MKIAASATILRWTIGLAFLGLASWFVRRGTRIDDFNLVLAAIPSFLLGVAFLWKTIFHLATRPLILLVDSMFFPGGRLEKPSLNLKLPRFYLNEGRYDEAMTEYRRILKYHPDEIEAYEKAIWLHVEIFDEPEKALRLVRRARRRGLPLEKRFERLAEDGIHRKRKTP